MKINSVNLMKICVKIEILGLVINKIKRKKFCLYENFVCIINEFVGCLCIVL